MLERSRHALGSSGNRGCSASSWQCCRWPLLLGVLHGPLGSCRWLLCLLTVLHGPPGSCRCLLLLGVLHGPAVRCRVLAGCVLGDVVPDRTANGAVSILRAVIEQIQTDV